MNIVIRTSNFWKNTHSAFSAFLHSIYSLSSSDRQETEVIGEVRTLLALTRAVLGLVSSFPMLPRRSEKVREHGKWRESDWAEAPPARELMRFSPTFEERSVTRFYCLDWKLRPFLASLNSIFHPLSPHFALSHGKFTILYRPFTAIS